MERRTVREDSGNISLETYPHLVANLRITVKREQAIVSFRERRVPCITEKWNNVENRKKLKFISNLC